MLTREMTNASILYPDTLLVAIYIYRLILYIQGINKGVVVHFSLPLSPYRLLKSNLENIICTDLKQQLVAAKHSRNIYFYLVYLEIFQAKCLNLSCVIEKSNPHNRCADIFSFFLYARQLHKAGLSND
jgi:hypothetical protein